MIKASIIIPTYNRPDFLTKTIRSLTNQSCPIDDYEVIVVDNGNQFQKNKKIVDSFAKQSRKYNLRYVKIDKIGVHYARNFGAKIAKGKLLIFTDDDCILDRNFISSYLEAFNKHPKLLASGGPIKPVWESSPPVWLLNFINKSKTFYMLSIMEPYKSFHLNSRGFFFSANIAIRQDTLLKAGGFNPELVGDNYVGDGETGLYKKLWQKNIFIGYVSKATVYHFIPKERMTIKYLTKRMINEGASNMYEKYHPRIPDKIDLLGAVLMLFIKNMKLLLVAQLKSGKTDINSLNIQLEGARIFGQILYIMKIIKSKEFRALVVKSDWLSRE